MTDRYLQSERGGRAILPTARCFDDAIELLEYLSRAQPRLVVESRDLWLVHGICQSHDEPSTSYAHAWVEMADQCFEAGILEGRRLFYAVPHERYYAARRVLQATAYSMLSVMAENERTNNYGPWQPEYSALCRTDGRVVIVGRIATLFTDETFGFSIDEVVW